MTDLDRLKQLLLARHACVAVSTFEEDYVLKLLGELAVESQSDLWIWSVTHGLRDGLVAGAPPIPDTENPAAALFHISRHARGRSLYAMLDVAGHLKDERALRTLRDAAHIAGEVGATVVLIDHHAELPPVVRSAAAEMELSLPDEAELEQLVRDTVRQENTNRPIDVRLTRRDLQTVVRNLLGLSRRQARQVILDCCCDQRFDAADLNTLLARKRQAVGDDGLLEYVESPVDLEEIGGMRRLKQWLARRHTCLSDEGKAFGLTAPRGVLMLGVQGAGKSLAAKAVATAWQRPLLRMDAGALYDRYIGESERRLRDALRQAERMAPVVLWIDEIEKGFASAASQSTDGGLSKRMFGALLTWMQEHDAPVFLVATANDIEALPPELLRKGRFDEVFFVDLPGLEGRHQILSIHLKKRKRDPKAFDLDALAEASAGYSGAEIEQAVAASLHEAFAQRAELTTGHVLEALKSSPPLSVTMREKIALLREWAKGRCVPAD